MNAAVIMYYRLELEKIFCQCKVTCALAEFKENVQKDMST